MPIELCPICGEKLVRPSGKPSPLLLVGEFPGQLEINMGVPWVGNAGEVLKAELDRAGISFALCRSTNLWLHAKPGDGKKKALSEIATRCYEFCLERLLTEMTQVSAVLLMGSELAPLFTGHPVGKINGARVQSTLAPSNVQVLVASYNPAICLQEGSVVGDYRFAVETFARHAMPFYKEGLHARH